jgi:Ribbon-helix-helix protein, copG family
MSKKVVSFRLSDKELAALDEACKRFGISRSQTVSAGISVLLAEYLKEDGTLLRRAPWFKTSLSEYDHDKN